MKPIQLLAVDDPDLLLALQPTFVRRAGWRVLTARDPREALAKARRARPDVVILDADGWGSEACRAMRLEERLSGIPVVLLASDPPRPTPPGAVSAVAKPVERAELLQAIRGFVPVAERGGSRRRTSLPVSYLRGDEECSARTKDLSVDGMFLQCGAPPAVGDRLRLRIDLPHESELTIRTTAHVVRSVAPERDSHLLAGAGLRFVKVSERDRVELARFVDAGE